MKNNTYVRIENELEVKAYLQILKYALDNGARFNFQIHRLVDKQREEHYTNKYNNHLPYAW